MSKCSEPPEDFAAGVLRRTTGSACEAAEPLLTALVDGGLGDPELVAGHVAHCTRCGALVAALIALPLELRSLAEVEPDPGFVDSVLAVTCDAPPAGRWRGLLLRPRFSMEVAFAASVLFTLLFGIPGPRLAAVDSAALAGEVRASVQGRLATVQRVWDQTAEPVAGSLETAGHVLVRTARSLARGSASDSRGENR